jgi:MFS transporter, DHA3 family, macrolide efflux protein
VVSQSQQPGLIRGLPAVGVLAASQSLSILTSEMAQFAIRIWAYELTNSVTALGLVAVFYITPFLIFSPIAGSWIDRYNRKLMMAMSDIGAALGTLVLLSLSWADALQIWHLYVAAAIGGLFGCFQWPAFSASISLMVPNEQLGRANGMMSLVEAGPSVVAPLLAGALLPWLGLTGLLAFDFATFVLALGALLLIVVPQPATTSVQTKTSVRSDAILGFRYILARPSLLGIQLMFFFSNLLHGIINTLLQPMVLARTGNDATQLGWVLTSGALGVIAGGAVMTASGGFKRRVHGVLLGWMLTGLFGGLLFGLGASIWVWSALMFVSALTMPLINGSNQAIWQSKVAPELQGRVFSARRLIAWLSQPITPLIAGLAADNWLEPAMRSDSTLASLFGGLVGRGPGSGMALAFVVIGFLMIAVGAIAYRARSVRDIETLLPNHNAAEVLA